MSETGRRLKKVLFSDKIISDMIVEGSVHPREKTRCIQGIPEGARLLYGFHDEWRRCFGAVYEHPDWEPVPEFGQIPEIRVMMQSIYEEEGGGRDG